jgi:hypothetical protein
MTPINRLIPQSSGSGAPHRSEHENTREHVVGQGMTPPIRPQASGEAQGDDIVNEILRDTEGEQSQVHMEPPPMEHHPSQYQEPEYPERMVRFEDEREMRPPSPKSVTKDEEADTDYIGLILNEMKLPLVVAVLILGASSTGLDSTIGKFIPALMNESALGYGGIIVKAVIGGLLFYALHRIFL